MPSKAPWDAKHSRVMVQIGGAGFNWTVFDYIENNSATVQALSGGGQAVEPRYGRAARKGFGAYNAVGLVPTGNPDVYTTTLTKRLYAPQAETGVNRLRTLYGCLVGIRIDEGCQDFTKLTNYITIKHLAFARGTSFDTTENLANGTEQSTPDVMVSIAISAINLIDGNKLAHLNISDNVVDVSINRVIPIGFIKCADGCSVANDGNQDFLAITDADSTPGHGGVAAPRILRTANGGTTWISVYIDDATGAAAHGTDVIYYAGYVYGVVPGASSPGVFYASLEDIDAQVSNPFVPMTGVVNAGAPQAGYAIGAKLYFGGLAGYIYESTDGATLTTLSAGSVTAQNINSVVFADENLGWFGGNSGALVRYFKGALSLVTISGLTGNITCVEVPDGRGSEIYVATSTGQIWRSRNGDATTPTWTQLGFPDANTGSIPAIRFDKGSGRGEYFFVVQTRADGLSRVLRDMSGGAMGLNDTEVIGSYNSPVQVGINDIAPSDPNVAITVGEAYNSVGFIGKVQ